MRPPGRAEDPARPAAVDAASVRSRLGSGGPAPDASSARTDEPGRARSAPTTSPPQGRRTVRHRRRAQKAWSELAVRPVHALLGRGDLRRGRLRRSATAGVGRLATAPGTGSASRPHARPDVERQRARIVRGEASSAAGVAEDRVQQRPPDPLAEPVGPDEQVGQVPAAAGVDGGAEPDDLAVGSTATSARPWSMRCREVRPD